MSTKVKEKQKNNKIIEDKKVDEKVFARIKTKFREYWKILFKLVGIYIISYLLWSWLIVGKGRDFVKNYGLDGDVLWFVIVMMILQGLLFCLDGFVTALLKSPFNQMCYAINKAEGIPDKKKDYIITKATESNEHCKETLKKFGIITIAFELSKQFLRVLVSNDNEKYQVFKDGKFEYLMVLSYLIPIIFAAYDIWQIHRELKKIEKLLVTSRGKKT